jgi:hypothetical protein
MQRFGRRDNSTANCYLCADTLTQCPIYPPPRPVLFITFYKQASGFFVPVEYKDGEVGWSGQQSGFEGHTDGGRASTLHGDTH